MQIVVGAAVVRHGRVLAARRATGGWEFPGGKVEDGEEAAAAVVREIAEELGCVVGVTGWLDDRVPIRAGLELRVATAVLLEGEPIPRADDHDAVRWLRADQLEQVAWLPADRPFLPGLRERLSGDGR